MDATLKSALYFLGGVSIGICGTLYTVREYYSRKASKTIDEMEAYIREEYAKRPAGSLGVTKESKEVVEKTHADHINKEKELVESYKAAISEMKTNYRKASEAKPADESVLEKIEEDRVEELEEKKSAPYIITLEQWSDPNPYYKKTDLIYEKEKSILVDYETNSLLDMYYVLGDSICDHLDRMEDGTYVYVRNDTISVDYQIEVREFDG